MGRAKRSGGFSVKNYRYFLNLTAVARALPLAAITFFVLLTEALDLGVDFNLVFVATLDVLVAGLGLEVAFTTDSGFFSAS